MACLHTDHKTIGNPQWAEEKESKRKELEKPTAQEWLPAGQKDEHFNPKFWVGQFSQA
jgi:hypothetical protein